MDISTNKVLRQFFTYLFTAYIVTFIMICFSFSANNTPILALILPALIIILFVWGAYRVYKKKSRKWFKTLRVFFFIGVGFILINSIGMLISAIKSPEVVYNQIAATFFSFSSFQLNSSANTMQALSCWATLSTMTILPLVPTWFLFSNTATALDLKRKK